MRGGREGLFLPASLVPGGELAIVEGPTDCAALLDLGLAVVGRPSCSGGLGFLVDLVRLLRPENVVIVADGDEPGRRGAEQLAGRLVAYCATLRVIQPPRGLKDVRAWKQRGATAADVQAAIDAAPVRCLSISMERSR